MRLSRTFVRSAGDDHSLVLLRRRRAYILARLGGSDDDVWWIHRFLPVRTQYIVWKHAGVASERRFGLYGPA